MLFIEVTRPLALAGFPQALIQRPDWDDEVASTAFWSNIALATLIALILWGAFTPFMVANYDPELKWVLPALSVSLILDAMRGDHTLFTTAEGIESLWERSAELLDDPPAAKVYQPGTWGPNAIHQLIAPNAWRLPFERAWRETKG